MTPRLVKLLDAWCPRFLRRYLDRLQASPVGLRLASGAFWTLLGTVISRGLALLGSIVVARILGVTGFGELGVIQSTVGMFGVFAGFGMGVTATKYVAEHRNGDQEKAGRTMGLCFVLAIGGGGVLSAALFFMAPWLASHALSAPGLTAALQIASVILFLSTLSGVQTGILAGFEAFKAVAHVNLWSGVLLVPLIVLGSYSGGVHGAVWGLAAGTAITCALNQYFLRPEIKKSGIAVRFEGCLRENSVIWSFSLPAMLSQITILPAMWLCNAILVNEPNGYAEMGIYNAANQWRMVLLLVAGTLNSAVLPVLAGLTGSSDRDQYMKVLLNGLLVNAVAAGLLGIPLIVLSPLIMKSYGPHFQSGYYVLSLLVVAGMIAAVLDVIGHSMAGQGRMWWGFSLNLLWACVLVGSAKMLSPWGALGIAAAMAIAYAVHFISVSLFTWATLSKRGAYSC